MKLVGWVLFLLIVPVLFTGGSGDIVIRGAGGDELIAYVPFDGACMQIGKYWVSVEDYRGAG